MAKRDYEDEELHEDAPEQEKPKEEPMAKPSHDGLVKMHKNGREIHAHPDVVEHHEKKGWKRA
ncbi:MAG: hypothetical protein WAL34_03980 [Acidobacteriaceae bacterium]